MCQVFGRIQQEWLCDESEEQNIPSRLFLLRFLFKTFGFRWRVCTSRWPTFVQSKLPTLHLLLILTPFSSLMTISQADHEVIEKGHFLKDPSLSDGDINGNNISPNSNHSSSSSNSGKLHLAGKVTPSPSLSLFLSSPLILLHTAILARKCVCVLLYVLLLITSPFPLCSFEPSKYDLRKRSFWECSCLSLRYSRLFPSSAALYWGGWFFIRLVFDSRAIRENSFDGFSLCQLG